MTTRYLLLNMILLAGLLISCNTSGKEKGKKYYIIVDRTSKSMISNRDEREDKKDSVLATSDENAYDSCIAILWGMRYADSIVKETLKTELEKQGRISEYGLRKQYLTWKIIGYKVINDRGVDIQDNISDSVKRMIQAKWKNGLSD
jgi:hypothetical protein